MEKLKAGERKWQGNAQNVGEIASVGDGPIAYTASSSGTGAGRVVQPTRSETAATCITAIDASLRLIADNLADIWAELSTLEGVIS